MQTANPRDGGHALRQTAPACGTTPAAVAKATNQSATSASASFGRILLSDAEGADLFGVGLRTFLELQHEPWFPTPRMLGKRLKRHVFAELLAAVEHMPRQQERVEPAQLARGKIEAMKARGAAA